MPYFYTRLLCARDIGGGEVLWQFIKNELYHCKDV
jgi:hypothetical protein